MEILRAPISSFSLDFFWGYQLEQTDCSYKPGGTWNLHWVACHSKYDFCAHDLTAGLFTFQVVAASLNYWHLRLSAQSLILSSHLNHTASTGRLRIIFSVVDQSSSIYSLRPRRLGLNSFLAQLYLQPSHFIFTLDHLAIQKNHNYSH